MRSHLSKFFTWFCFTVSSYSGFPSRFQSFSLSRSLLNQPASEKLFFGFAFSFTASISFSSLIFRSRIFAPSSNMPLSA